MATRSIRARPSTWHGAHNGDIRPQDGSFVRGIPASIDRKLIFAGRSTAGFGGVRDLQMEVKPPCVPPSSLQTHHSDGSSGEPGSRWLLERSRTFLTSSDGKRSPSCIRYAFESVTAVMQSVLLRRACL